MREDITQGKQLPAASLQDKILELLGRPDYTPLDMAGLGRALGLQRSASQVLNQTLARMERAGQIARLKQGNRFGLPLQADLVPGRIRINRQGGGVLQPTDPRLPAIRVPSDATGTAMHGDRVLVRRDAAPRRVSGAEEPPAGRVVRVLERARTSLVGTLQAGRQFLYVIPDDPRIPQDIYVPPPTDVGRPAVPGDKVVVELREWTSRHTNPEGEIIEVLGSPDAEGVDMLSVIRQYQLSLHFPKKVLQEAKSIGSEVRDADLRGRTDCRGHEVITIDPEDAKDFDDAICLQSAGPDRWKLWVHIADVSHYVKPRSALDQEAERRGNSTYLVDRVVPMLPEALSNELCSLKPHVDRLTKCVEFLLSSSGQVLKTQFYPAVIRSRCRYNYREVLGILQRAPLDSLEQMLQHAHKLAQQIRRDRFRAGSLDLDFPETKIRLDERGRVLRIEKVENDISHQLIEEFMLLANEAVATRLMGSGRPALYRIHEPPDKRRLGEFREDVLGHRIQCGNLTDRREVQKLLERLNRLPIGPALKIGFLRSLMRARYSVEALGHYGLAKKKYTHFTSPIRRYADLIVHRALFEPAGVSVSSRPLAEIADHLSETERNSSDAERDSRDVKLFAFLLSQLKNQPQTYAALITDVRNFGFFVDVTGLGMSGLVPLSGLNDDFYQFDPRQNHLVGRRTRRVIKLGDRVEVQVAKVDRFKRQVDFKLIEPPRTGRQPERPSRGQKFRKPFKTSRPSGR
ncbi:MAG TPA: ribonuclease R [Verrucomicrobiae bacterium]|nr:ribonuclease R [Verrucomicrobiae bacterium]